MTAIKEFFKTILYKPIFNLLIYIVWLLPGDNLGWAIIILTILIRLLLYPSQKKSIESQKQITEMQPKLDEIKKKYPNDQQKQAEATMDLYKQHKVNPLSSCLPLLIQLPILIILYRAFTAGLSTDRFAELLYTFTPRPETINTFFYGINLSDPNIYLAIIAGVMQFIQTRQITARQDQNKSKVPAKKGDPAAAMGDFSKQMMYIFPLFTVFIGMKLPAALALYWIITTLFMVIQQKIIYSSKTKVDPKGVSVKVKN